MSLSGLHKSQSIRKSPLDADTTRARLRAGDFPIGDGAPGPVAKAIKAKLTGIQRGEVADEFGWVHRVF